MSWDEAERVLGHADGTVVIRHKRMWQFYVEEEHVTLLFKGYIYDKRWQQRENYMDALLTVKDEIVSLAYDIEVSVPPLLFVHPFACVSGKSVSVRSGKAHSSIWLSFQCVKLHRISQ